MDHKRAREVAQDVVTSSWHRARRSIANWQTNCNISDVYQDEVFMLEITQNTISCLPLANPNHGGYERNRSQEKAFGLAMNSEESSWELPIIVGEEEDSQGTSLEVMWRNPLPHVRRP